jgi:hypothetical protein
LTPASRRQNHTTSPSASRAVRQQHISVHRIPPRVRDDRERPSVGRDGGSSRFDLGKSRTKIFLQRGLDREINDLLVGHVGARVLLVRSHCEERSDEASTLCRPRDGLLRGACHRARIRATRWLAMTRPVDLRHSRNAAALCSPALRHSPYRPTNRSAKYAMVLR